MYVSRICIIFLDLFILHYTFPKIINPKVNAVAGLEFKLAYFEATVKRLIHQAMGSALIRFYQKGYTNWCLLNFFKYKGHSINKVNFVKEVCNRKHCLQLEFYQGNQ